MWDLLFHQQLGSEAEVRFKMVSQQSLFTMSQQCMFQFYKSSLFSWLMSQVSLWKLVRHDVTHIDSWKPLLRQFMRHAVSPIIRIFSWSQDSRWSPNKSCLQCPNFECFSFTKATFFLDSWVRWFYWSLWGMMRPTLTHRSHFWGNSWDLQFHQQLGSEAEVRIQDGVPTKHV